MHWIAEITLTDVPTDAALGWAETAFTGPVAPLPGLTAIDLYTPVRSDADDPLNPPETPPALVVILSFDTEAALRAALSDGPLGDLKPPGTAWGAAFKRRFYPVPQGTGALDAPVSYLVRYDLPASNAAQFQAAYTDGHPQVQAHLPGIRTILCDIPLAGLGLPGMADPGWLIGNEVAFDSTASFAQAMRSPARADLRAHMADLPPWSGVNHHHLMHRRRLPHESR